jgi:FKBP-type peptidyl-prolyl cis-trans isomerase (trigger factor)
LEGGLGENLSSERFPPEKRFFKKQGVPMQIIVHDSEDQKKEIQIETDWDAIQADYDDILSKYLKVPVPGFRPGKAPKKMVEQRFRKKILDDLGMRCTQRLSRQALEKKGLTSTGQMLISDIEVERGKPFRFKVQCSVLPEFELPDYTELKLKTQTDDQMRDEVSEWLLDQTEIDVPGELVRQELAFDGNNKAQPESEDWNAAFTRVKLLIIMREIAHQDGIEVDDRDVEERIEAMASEFGKRASAFRQQVIQDGGLSRIRGFLLAEKTLDYLLEICS